MTRVLHLMALCAVLFLLPQCALATPVFSRMVIFGDSYSDVGNSPIDVPGYYMSRRSNGPVWVEDLASKLGVPNATASLWGGPNATNFAYSGAPAAGTNPNDTSIPNLTGQVSLYLRSRTPAAGDLFVIEIGGVDYLRGGQTNPTVPANAIVNQIKRLAGAGAKSFLIANVMPIGFMPLNRFTQDETRLNSLTDRFNKTLADDLTALRPTLDPGVDLRLFDLHDIFTKVLANPRSFGFTNATQGANDVGARDPDHYVFWDYGHPTRVMHQLIAERAYETLPEPSAVALLGLCGLTLVGRRRPPLRRERTSTGLARS